MTSVPSQGQDEFRAGYEAYGDGEQLLSSWSNEKKAGWSAARDSKWTSPESFSIRVIEPGTG